ncbi:hypothetical protein Landi51_13206 [Colletotrichum acutatum]
MPPTTLPSPISHTTSDNAIRTLHPVIFPSDQRAKVGWPLKCYDDLTATEKRIPDIWMGRHHECSRLWSLDTAEAQEAARAKIWELAFSKWDTDTPVPQPTRAVVRKTQDSIIKIGVLTEDAEPFKKLHGDDISIASSDPRSRRLRCRGDDVFLKAKVD